MAAKGSVLSPRHPPPRPTRWNLYSAPLGTPGANPSQIPDPPRDLSGWVRGPHELKSPITQAESAFGAHTAKYVPVVPPASSRWAPTLSASPACVPSLNKYRSSSATRVTSYSIGGGARCVGGGS